MFGLYEQVPPFGFRRKKVFSVVERGIEWRGRLYEWSEITDFQAFHGVGLITFSDDSKCRIHMNSFRRNGERGRISFLGHNAAFNELAKHWHKEKLEKLKSPRWRASEAEVFELADALQSASDPNDIAKIEEELTRANREFIGLQTSYVSALDSEYKKLRRSDQKRFAIMVVAGLLALAIILLRRV